MASFCALSHAAREYVRVYMARYDGSHDFEHIKRVEKLALHILAEESNQAADSSSSTQGRSTTYDERAVMLAALMHDIGDKKYAKPDEDAENLVTEFLQRNGCPADLLTKVVAIVQHVSYSNEVKHPEAVQIVRKQHPELDIVQDADRLDAIGAVGIARTFTYGGACRPHTGLDNTIEHFTDKLEKLEGMMKTKTGRCMAKRRTERLVLFRQWFEEESSVNGLGSLQ
ncbi:hypothetical protein MBLNU230_g5820t1 [Neophaeotheca triangularis]